MKTKTCVVVSLLLLFACTQKEEFLNSSVTKRSPNDPSVIDGILSFDDFEHLDEYYDFLDDEVASVSSQ